MRDRAIVGAVALSLLVTGALTVRVIAIDKPAVFVILVPALAGAFMATRRRGRVALCLSALLTGLTAMFGLIGGWGLLYVPSIALLIWGSVTPRQRVATH